MLDSITNLVLIMVQPYPQVSTSESKGDHYPKIPNDPCRYERRSVGSAGSAVSAPSYGSQSPQNRSHSRKRTYLETRVGDSGGVVGSRVYCPWKDGLIYPAVIVDVKDGERETLYSVEFGNRDVIDLGINDIIGERFSDIRGVRLNVGQPVWCDVYRGEGYKEVRGKVIDNIDNERMVVVEMEDNAILKKSVLELRLEPRQYKSSFYGNPRDEAVAYRAKAAKTQSLPSYGNYTRFYEPTQRYSTGSIHLYNGKENSAAVYPRHTYPSAFESARYPPRQPYHEMKRYDYHPAATSSRPMEAFSHSLPNSYETGRHSHEMRMPPTGKPTVMSGVLRKKALITKSKKSLYKCTWKDCGRILGTVGGIKRHITKTHFADTSEGKSPEVEDKYYTEIEGGSDSEFDVNSRVAIMSFSPLLRSTPSNIGGEINGNSSDAEREPPKHKEGSQTQKCRKRFGLARRSEWCSKCRWKKACERFTG